MLLVIDDVPYSLNRVLRMHWVDRMKYKRVWESYMFLWPVKERLALQKLHDAKTKMRISVMLHHSRLYDRDNSFGAVKVLFDAMRDTSLLWDDRPEFLEPHVEQEKCPHVDRHTTLEVTACIG